MVEDNTTREDGRREHYKRRWQREMHVVSMMNRSSSSYSSSRQYRHIPDMNCSNMTHYEVNHYLTMSNKVNAVSQDNNHVTLANDPCTTQGTNNENNSHECQTLNGHPLNWAPLYAIAILIVRWWNTLCSDFMQASMVQVRLQPTLVSIKAGHLHQER